MRNLVVVMGLALLLTIPCAEIEAQVVADKVRQSTNTFLTAGGTLEQPSQDVTFTMTDAVDGGGTPIVRGQLRLARTNIAGYKYFGLVNFDPTFYLGLLTTTEIRFHTGVPDAVEKMRLSQAGNLGIGTVDPQYPLDVAGEVRFGNVVRAAAGAWFQYTSPETRFINLNSGGNIVFRNAANSGALLTISNAGDVTVTGNIGARYQDLAEWVPSTSELEPGTLVVLNPHKRNEVMMSSSAYDTKVAGVVSERPGIILGESGDGKEAIATTGRVRLRVDATRAPVQIGDLLVTSDKPGTAMVSKPIGVGENSFHRPGTIVGKALEPLPEGEGMILVLLTLQ